MNRYGIIQGRLTVPHDDSLQYFPQDNWKEEFKIARNLGFNFIEIFAEREFNKKNPLWSDSGRKEINMLIEENSLEIYSACNDFIIGNSIEHKEGKAFNNTIEFIECVSKLKCKLAILPFFNKSEINLEKEIIWKNILNKIISFAKSKNVMIGVEVNLEANKLIYFLSTLENQENVKIVYDTGNRVSDGANIKEEINILSDYICHVHIKDKNKNNENVLLGNGIVNFESVFDSLHSINYKGPIVFETFRGRDPKKTAEYNINFCEFFTFQSK